MKQLLLRIPDDLHHRITARAQRSGRSANAIATEILEVGVLDETGDERAALRAKARRLGVLGTSPGKVAGVPIDSAGALASMSGVGPVLDDLLADGR